MPDYGILGDERTVDRLVHTLTRDRWDVFYKRGRQTFKYGDATSYDGMKLGVRMLFDDHEEVTEADIYLNGSKHSTAHREPTGIVYRSVGGGYRTPG